MAIAAATQTCQEMIFNVVPLLLLGTQSNWKTTTTTRARVSLLQLREIQTNPSGRCRRDRGGAEIEGGGGKWLNSWRGDALKPGRDRNGPIQNFKSYCGIAGGVEMRAPPPWHPSESITQTGATPPGKISIAVNGRYCRPWAAFISSWCAADIIRIASLSPHS